MSVVTVGDNCIDNYSNLQKSYPTGNAVNVAIHLKRLGVETSVVSLTGNDQNGHEMIRLLQGQAIDLTYFHQGEGKTAVTEMNLVNKDRVHVRYEEGVLKNFRLKEDEVSFINGHQIVHTSIWGKVNQHLPQFRSAGTTVVYDFSVQLDYEGLDELLPHIDYAFFSYDQVDHFVKEFMKEKKNLGPKVIIVTLGENGSIAYDGNKFYKVDSLPVQVVNTVGAGDSFIAGYIYGLLHEESVMECLYRGSALASKVVCRFEPY